MGHIALVGDGGPVVAAGRGLPGVGAQTPAVTAGEAHQPLAVGAVALAVARAPVRPGEHPPGEVEVGVVEVEQAPVRGGGDLAGVRGRGDQPVPVRRAPVALVLQAERAAGGVEVEQCPTVVRNTVGVPADQRPDGEVGVVRGQDPGEVVEPGLLLGVGRSPAAGAELTDPHRCGEVLAGPGDEQGLVVDDLRQLRRGEVLVAGVARGAGGAARRARVRRTGVAVEVRRVDQLARVDQGVGEVADRGQLRPAVAEHGGRYAVPVDALHDDEQVGVGPQDPVPGLLEGGVLVVAVAQAPVGVVPGVAADLVAQVGADHALVLLVPAGQEDPVVDPLLGGLAAVPALVAVQAAAEPVAGGVVVEDHREAVGGQRRHDRVEHLERGLPAQLRVGRDGDVRHRARVVQEGVGEGQPDAVDAEAVEAAQDVGDRGPVQAERQVVGDLSGLVVGRGGGRPAALPGALGAGPVAGPELEAGAGGVDDVAAPGAERAGPGGGQGRSVEDLRCRPGRTGGSGSGGSGGGAGARRHGDAGEQGGPRRQRAARECVHGHPGG